MEDEYTKSCRQPRWQMGLKNNTHIWHVVIDISLAPQFDKQKVCERTGAVVEVIPSSESGELDVAALEEMLSRGGVKAVAITHVPTNGGVVNPATEGLNHGTIRGTLRFCHATAPYTSQSLRHPRPHSSTYREVCPRSSGCWYAYVRSDVRT